MADREPNPRIARSGLLAVLAVTAGLLLAACTSTAAGQAGPASSSPPTPSVAGDPVSSGTAATVGDPGTTAGGPITVSPPSGAATSTGGTGASGTPATTTVTTTVAPTGSTTGSATGSAAATTSSSDPATSSTTIGTTGTGGAPTTGTTGTTGTTTITTATGSTNSTTSGTTTSTSPTSTLLKQGSSGPAVLALQQKLTSLGYWLGTPDGQYGVTTAQAVMAYQWVAGISVDGEVGPQTAAALTRDLRPTPRTTSGTAINVDLEKQIVMFVINGKLTYILHTSTAGGYQYTEAGHTYTATTPTGNFTIERAIDGMRTSLLGQLWRPRYFTGGYALHGDSDVPPYPASHGCVRVSNQAIDWVWANNLAPIGIPFIVY